MVHFPMLRRRSFVTANTIALVVFAGLAGARAGDTPSPALLVLHKGENAIAVVDIKSLTEMSRLKTGHGPDGMAWLEAKH